MKYQRPAHRIRHNIEKLRGRKLKNPNDKYIVSLTKKLLKNEEINGSGFWSDAWDITKDVLSFPADVIENVPFAKLGLELAVPELAPFIEPGLQIKKMIYGNNTNQYLRDAFNTEDEPEKTEQNDTIEDVMDQQIQDITERTQPADTVEMPRTPKEIIMDPYSSAQTIQYDDLQQHLAPLSSLSFPTTQNFDPRDEPLGLREFLLKQGMAGAMVSNIEYKNIIKKQQPRYLSFPGKFYSSYPYAQ
jgi:hypothetical protein